MTAPARDTLLFDLDGTLADSLPDLAAACNRMREALSLAPLKRSRYAEYVGKGSDMLVKRAIANHRDRCSIEPALFERGRALFRQFYHEENGRQSRLYDGIPDMLERLQTRGWTLAVVTNKPMEFAEPLLNTLKIASYFQIVVAGDTCSRKKPDPEPIFHALKHLGKTPEQAIFVGDSINDAQAAQAAGVPCVLFPYGYNEGADVQKLKVSAIVFGTTEFLAWLDKFSTP